jgi:membrane fusion protein (multidrug efflux system)
MTNQKTINTTMKKIIAGVLALTMAACGSKSAGDKKAELEKLRKQKADIEANIAKLETEVAKTDTTAKAKQFDVATMAVKAERFKTYIEVQGRVDAEESVSLSSEMPGTITKITTKVGQTVSKGQVLAETDSRAVQQQLAAMQTNLALANQVYEKQKSLWDQKIGTEVQFLQAKANKEALESQVAATQEQLRMSRIISPIDGTVDMVNIKVGQAVNPGMPAITVINFGTLKVKAELAESYASRVHTGDEALVYLPDMQDSLRSKVVYASRGINPVSRTFAVEVPLDTKKEYHPNMVARLRINDYQSAQPVVAIPVKYIQRDNNETYVMLAVNGKAHKAVIKTGREYSGQAEVLEGLKEGDLLITEGYDLVNEGDAVKESSNM